MAPTILLTIAVAIAIYSLVIAWTTYRNLMRHIAEAKASGIHYDIVPFFLVNRFYQLSCTFLLPLLRKLPESWTESWLDLTLEWGWKRRYEPFAKRGVDTFLTVSPERIVLNTAEASVITQITNRRNDFPKALEVYDSLRLYGENVVVVEGQRWRHHRKIVSPPFSEKNNGLVWQETLDQTRTMVGRWFDAPEKPESRTLTEIADDAMRLSLHVISRAGFGVPLKWPKKGEEGSNMEEKLENGHTMTYTEALGSLLHNILWLLAVPRGLLKILPFKITKLAQRSFVEWGQYMGEMYDRKKSAVLSGDSPDQLDLMVAMIKNANVTSDPSTQTLTDTEILGNAFVFILAGHETTANSIHFSLIYLALNIASQRHLQRDLDSIFGTRQVSEWSYDNDVPKLFSSMAGAVMNEELRLAAPVVGVPKCTAPDSPQPLIVGGKKCTVPGNVYIQLITPATHRNPNQWPAGPPRDPHYPAHPISNRDNDLEEFKPERWILDTEAKRQAAKEAFANAEPDGSSDSAAAAALGVNTASDTAPGLYKPPKGAYIPFSEGYRSCIGRRFAQIELLAAIAVIFKEYSVELAVDEWASDAKVERMGRPEREVVWEKAREKVETQLIDDMGSKITLQLQVGHVALRLVKRGSERFDFPDLPRKSGVESNGSTHVNGGEAIFSAKKL